MSFFPVPPSVWQDPLVRPVERWGPPGSAGRAPITVVIASIPPRSELLARALASVCAQTLRPEAVIVEIDHDRTGAADTKNRAIWKASTEWVAPVDDDDLFLPYHLEALYGAAQEHAADVVYSVPHIPQASDFRDSAGRHGVPFDPDEMMRRSYVQTTSLLRQSMVERVGGFQRPDVVTSPDDPRNNYDDWGLYKQLVVSGAKFWHHAESTFVWNHWGFGTPGHPGNTSGRADRW